MQKSLSVYTVHYVISRLWLFRMSLGIKFALRFSPYTNVLVLTCQMMPSIPVIGLHLASSAPKVVLGASLGGQIVIIAVILCDLYRPGSSGSTGALLKVESQLVASVRGVNIHCIEQNYLIQEIAWGQDQLRLRGLDMEV